MKVFHTVASGLTLPAESIAGEIIAATGRVLMQGETFEVSDKLYEETKNRLGVSWLDATDDEQVARWGQVMFRPGPAPADIRFGGDDESHMYKAGLRARAEAEAISDSADRARALTKVREEYGEYLHPVAETSRVYKAGS